MAGPIRHLVIKDTAASVLVAITLGSLPLEEGSWYIVGSLMEKRDQGTEAPANGHVNKLGSGFSSPS